jgi:inorganic pyrophosphatase
VPIGPEAPAQVTAYIEIVPTDTVKYELDKISGLLRIDRPQLYSNVCPALYGLIPQTYCGERVADFCQRRTGLPDLVGDQDPLDVCVLTEKSISHGDILLQARPIGGLRMLDDREADDKIVAVMQGDAAYGQWTDIGQCPTAVIDRLQHYFLTYKDAPGSPRTRCKITHVYGRDEAHEVIRRSQEDYRVRFGGIEHMLTAALRD